TPTVELEIDFYSANQQSGVLWVERPPRPPVRLPIPADWGDPNRVEPGEKRPKGWVPFPINVRLYMIPEPSEGSTASNLTNPFIYVGALEDYNPPGLLRPWVLVFRAGDYLAQPNPSPTPNRFTFRFHSPSTLLKIDGRPARATEDMISFSG